MLVIKLTLFILFGCFCYVATITTTTEVTGNINFKSNHEHIDAIFQRCPGFCNKKYCKIMSSCRPYNRTSKIKRLDIYFHDGVKLESPAFIEIVTFKKFRTEYRQHMVKMKEDLCKLLTMSYHPFFAFLAINKTRGNLVDPCPIYGHRYEVPRYTSTWVGTLVPTGEWRMDFIVTKVSNGMEEHVLTVSHYILVKPKNAFEEF